MPYIKTRRGMGTVIATDSPTVPTVSIGPGESPMGENPQPGDVRYTSLPAPTVDVLPDESNVFTGKPPGPWDRFSAWVSSNPTTAVIGALALVMFVVPPTRGRR